MKKALLLFAALLVAGCGEKSLSDSAIKKALEEAVEGESLQERNDLHYQVNESEPYSGWVKQMYDSGQAQGLVRFKDGKPGGPSTEWNENGQKMSEGTYNDGELVSAKTINRLLSNTARGVRRLHFDCPRNTPKVSAK